MNLPLVSTLPFRFLATVLLVASASASGGGFTPGELVLYNQALHGGSSVSGGLVRIDPATGTVTSLVDFTGSSQQLDGSACYDPFRDRVLFVAAFPTVSDPRKLWMVDAAGATTELGFPNQALAAMAPGSGGRIYMRRPVTTAPLVYLDAANTLQTLMDASGSAPYQPPHHEVRALLYHAPSNSLFAVTPQNTPWSCGPTTHVSVHRLRLSADGARVLAEDGCVAVAADLSGSNAAVGLSHGPGGQLLLVIDTNSNAQQPRMQLVDPATLAVAPFASNGSYTGAAATNAGTWSSQLGRAVIFDTFSNLLRSYGLGETGNGSTITPSSPISSAGGSGETATLIEVPPALCSNLVATYCSAKTTSGGCLPVISASGCPSASAPSGFSIQATQVEPGNVGIFFYGQSGAASAPFQGGFLCVQPPTLRTGPQGAGGGGPCSGSYAIDFNAYVAGGADPQLVAASVVHGQFWFRDPPEPISGTGLSGGVTFTLAP